MPVLDRHAFKGTALLLKVESDVFLSFVATEVLDKWYRRPDLNRHAFKGTGF